MATTRTRVKKAKLSAFLDAVADSSVLIGPVNRYLLQKEAEKKDFIQQGYHPSSLDEDTCPRYLVLQKLGCQSPLPHPPETLRYFRYGNMLHANWQKDVVRAGLVRPWHIEVPIHESLNRVPEKVKKILEIPETEIPKDWQEETKKAAERCAPYELRGQIDIFLPGEREIVDLKSCNSINFQKFPAKRQAIPKHKIQVSLYAWAFQASRVRILYENKDNQRPVEVPFTPDREGVEKVLSKIQGSIQALKSEELPPRLEECPRMAAPRASRCPLAATCFGGKRFKTLDRRHQLPQRDYQ